MSPFAAWYYIVCEYVYVLQTPVITQSGSTSLLTAECLYIAIKSEQEACFKNSFRSRRAQSCTVLSTLSKFLDVWSKHAPPGPEYRPSCKLIHVFYVFFYIFLNFISIYECRSAKVCSCLSVLQVCSVIIFLIINPTRYSNFSNLFWNETVHVSDSSSVHQQEFSTVHTVMVNVIQVC
jgi:hypothetical protein